VSRFLRRSQTEAAFQSSRTPSHLVQLLSHFMSGTTKGATVFGNTCRLHGKTFFASET
jgi:hypothetical protein